MNALPNQTALLRMIVRYCNDHGMAETAFGRAALKDPRLIGDMRRGRKPTPCTAHKLVTYMQERAA
jgi:hypothetical protein